MKAWDLSDADDVATTFGVSRAWVHRLAQRHGETGSIEPPKPTKFRSRLLAGQEERLKALVNAKPDATLAELREALPTTAALSMVWLEIDRLELTFKKIWYTPKRNGALTSPSPGVAGPRRYRYAMPRATSSSTNQV